MDESLDNDEVDLKEENVEEINKAVILVFNFFDICIRSFIFVVLIFSFVFRTVGVEGHSMDNTLDHKDRLIIFSPTLRKPKVKDIVVLNTVDTLDSFIVKRIIAVEGQTIDMKKNESHYDVYIDGVKIDEDYIKEPIDLDNIGNLKYPITVPKGYVFVMGDNRNDSKDSRALGLINIEKIKGVVFARFLPLRSIKIF